MKLSVLFLLFIGFVASCLGCRILVDMVHDVFIGAFC